MPHLLALGLLVLGGLMATPAIAAPAAGPLRVHPTNPRYFTDGTQNSDGSLRAVYLTGAHTWNSLVDIGRSDPPEAFDWDGYLNVLESHGHNFIRLWAWDSTAWDTRANGALGKDFVHHAAPMVWARTGPGAALDGKPKFDLTKFDPLYFERLRTRVETAGQRGIYVSVMLFEGWGLQHGNRRKGTQDAWAWQNHPFHPANNVNGIDGSKPGDPLSGAVHSTTHPDVNTLQLTYIHKVVDTVNDLDNVLYEVCNEGGQKEWNWWVVDQLHAYEQTKPKQHAVGITGHGTERLASMIASPADWTSPGSQDGYRDDPPAWPPADGAGQPPKVSLLDTDHIWGIGGTAAWAWKAFVRGHNPLFMDIWDGSVLGTPGDPKWEPLRQALGQTRRLALRLELHRMQPAEALASSQYCLADPGRAYVAYLPSGGEVTVDLTGHAGSFVVEWIPPVTGAVTAADAVQGGGAVTLKAPFEGHAAVYLRRP